MLLSANTKDPLTPCLTHAGLLHLWWSWSLSQEHRLCPKHYNSLCFVFFLDHDSFQRTHTVIFPVMEKYNKPLKVSICNKSTVVKTVLTVLISLFFFLTCVFWTSQHWKMLTAQTSWNNHIMSYHLSLACLFLDIDFQAGPKIWIHKHFSLHDFFFF